MITNNRYLLSPLKIMEPDKRQGYRDVEAMPMLNNSPDLCDRPLRIEFLGLHFSSFASLFLPKCCFLPLPPFILSKTDKTMTLLEWIAKEIKKRIPRYKRLRPVAERWRSKTVEHRGEGDLECWILVTDLYFGKPYFVINFRNRVSGKTVRINILPWQEEKRTPRKLLKPMRKMMVGKREKKESPFIFNPLYVSDQLSIKDIEAQIAFRLLQEGEPDFSHLLKSWLLYTFPKVSRIDDLSLSELVEYLRTHLSLSEDWRAFRKYVKKIVDRFSSRMRKILRDEKIEEDIKDDRIAELEEVDELQEVIKEETEKMCQDYVKQGPYSADMIVQMLGVPEGKLYRWIREGKIRKTEQKGVMVVDIVEVRQFWEWKAQRKELAKQLSNHLHIDQDSARRWIRRLENKGQNPKEIIEKARRKISKTV